jgi:putative oxidoreductase
MRGVLGIQPGWGLTLVRISTGLIFAVHGYQKFTGGIAGVVGFFTKLGIPAPGVMAPFIATLELAGGVLLILGLLTRWVALLLVIEMIVTAFWVQIPARGWNASDLDRSLLAASLALFLAGPGRAAIDAFFSENSE